MSSLTGRPSDETFDERCPAGLAIGLGSAALTVTTLVAAMLPVPIVVRLGMMVLAVAVLTVWSGYGRVALGLAGIAWSMGNGFLLNHDGSLSWHTGWDFRFIDALLLVVAVGMVVAQARHRARQHDRWHPFVDLLDEQELPVDTAPDAGVPGRPGESVAPDVPGAVEASR
jgi:hypothetical protein